MKDELSYKIIKDAYENFADKAIDKLIEEALIRFKITAESGNPRMRFSIPKNGLGDKLYKERINKVREKLINDYGFYVSKSHTSEWREDDYIVISITPFNLFERIFNWC